MDGVDFEPGRGLSSGGSGVRAQEKSAQRETERDGAGTAHCAFTRRCCLRKCYHDGSAECLVAPPSRRRSWGASRPHLRGQDAPSTGSGQALATAGRMPALQKDRAGIISKFMLVRPRNVIGIFCLPVFLAAASSAGAVSGASWDGVLRDDAGKAVADAVVRLHPASGGSDYTSKTSAKGRFAFADLAAGSYEVSVKVADREWKTANPMLIKDAAVLTLALQLASKGQEVRLVASGAEASAQASGGEHLSSAEVSSLPLNARDFSKLLLLAAGTMTDANGAANFTQQFAVNGQRGVATVFSTDGFDTTDPEMGGATFSNFNVDAIQEVQANSGVMAPEIGHGAASFTNVVTKSGVNQVHGSVFEFLRNAAFDARNYFDYKDPTGRRRIPPFVRNEFGFTNGGPVVIPGIYNGRDRTFYFGEYQGFREVLGTTQVLPVPTLAERQGIDTTTFPDDTLTVPVNAAVLPVLMQYPLPNQPAGAFGDRTYAASSKVVTRTDQFSVRIDHQISSEASLVTRFSLNQVTGPLTNPDQTAIDPSFGGSVLRSSTQCWREVYADDLAAPDL